MTCNGCRYITELQMDLVTGVTERGNEAKSNVIEIRRERRCCQALASACGAHVLSDTNNIKEETAAN